MIDISPAKTIVKLDLAKHQPSSRTVNHSEIGLFKAPT